MKRTLAIILAVVMLVSLFAGCNNNSSASTTAAAASTTKAAASTTKAAAATTTAAAAPANPYEEHMDITYASHYMQGLNPDNPAQKELEEMFNVTFDLPDMDLNSDFATFKLKVTAGEIPDFTMMNQSLTLVLEWYDNEVIRTIPVDLIRTYAPAWAKVMDADPAGWKVYPVEGTEDEIMAMTGYMPKQMQYGCWNDYYRYDWLETLGIEMPGEVKLVHEGYDYLYYTEDTFTLDEQWALFEKVMTGDPNGNGQADEKITTGYPNYHMHGFQSILGAFGIVQNKCIEENGVTKYPYATEAFKEGMKYLNKMYEAGMIDEDFASSQWSNNNEKYRTGVYVYHAGNADYMYDDSTRAAGTGGWARAPFTMITDFPEGKIVTMPPVQSSTGVNNSSYYAVSPFRYQCVFGEQVDDEKMARILSIFNYSMWDDATYERFYYGREGIEYTMEDDGRGGKVRVVTEAGAPAESGLYVFCQGMFDLVGRGDQFSTSFAKALAQVKTSPGFMDAAAGPHRMDLYNETQLAALEAEASATISTIVDEWWIGVICGTVDADASWDSYLAQLEAAGYKEIEAELNKAPLYTDLFPTMKGPNK